ncbi:MAG: glycosyltransferase family 2 protein [Verrucomicrobiales bacterium]|nr:glycosyltransferase family 2 protein [Verrucomicrobiales bacterium]
MSADGVFFTVFTPTFNRAHTLGRVRESLEAQTCGDFEWLVVDDGSEDGTEALMRGWMAEGKLPLRYVRQVHGGAQVAHNTCLREARGQVVIKLDSDDGCVPQALERLKTLWEEIPAVERERFSGLTVLCEDQQGQLVGTPFPCSPLDCSTAELEYRYRVRGEKWGFVRTDLLRRYPLPEDVRGHYVPESFVWARLAQEFLTRHVNERLRIYWMDAPSLVHGPLDPRVNADGHRLLFETVLNLEAPWVRVAPLRLLRAAAQFARFSWLSGQGMGKQWRALRPGLPRLLWVVGLPVAGALRLRDAVMAWRRRN